MAENGPKRARFGEKVVFSDAEKSCGAVWFEGLPTGVSVVSLSQRIVGASNGKLQEINVRVRPRAQRGGVLVHFEPKALSAVAYEIAESLGFHELRVHPPTQAREDSKNDVVIFNVPTVHVDEDLLYFLDPKPIKVERFKRRDGSVSRTVRVFFSNPIDAQKALRDGVKLDRIILRCKPYVSAPPVFCRRCKEFGSQHLDCAVVCAKCGGNHATSKCHSDASESDIVCLKCKGPHLFFKCPEVAKRRAQAVKHKQGSNFGRKSYKEALCSPPKSEAEVLQIVENTAFCLIPTIVDAVLGELSGLGSFGDKELTDEFFFSVQELVAKSFDFDKFSLDMVECHKSESKQSFPFPSGTYNTKPKVSDIEQEDDDVSISGMSSHSQVSVPNVAKIPCKVCGVSYHKKGLRTHETFCFKKHHQRYSE